MLDSLAAATEGFAGADLQALCASAVLAAFTRSAPGFLDVVATAGEIRKSVKPAADSPTSPCQGLMVNAEDLIMANQHLPETDGQTRGADQTSGVQIEAPDPYSALKSLRVHLTQSVHMLLFWYHSNCHGFSI